MRVAFIHPFMYRYRRGIERFILNTSNALSRQHIEVSILTWRHEHNFQLDTLSPSVHMHDFGPFRYFAAQRVIPFYVLDLIRNNYDLVNICFADYGEAEALYLANRLKRIRYNILFLYPIQNLPHRYRGFQRLGTLSGAERLISLSKFVADGLGAFCGRESQVITGGVDVNKFKPDEEMRRRTRAALGVDDSVPILITVCALERHKGIEKVIRALPHVVKLHRNVRYLVVGEGPFRLTLEALIAELNLKNTVSLLGSQPEIVPFLSSADTYLLLSDPGSEALAIAVLEAMAMEIPVVVPRVPPFTEYVTQECGVLAPAESPEHLAEVIIHLIEHRQQRVAMGKQARYRIQENYSWDQVARQYRLTFEEQLALKT